MTQSKAVLGMVRAAHGEPRGLAKPSCSAGVLGPPDELRQALVWEDWLALPASRETASILAYSTFPRFAGNRLEKGGGWGKKRRPSQP